VNYVPQTQALKNRLQKTGAWLSTIGKSAYALESNFQERINKVSSGSDSKYDDTRKVAIGDAAHFLTGTVAIAAADGAVTGVTTLLDKAVVGDKLVVRGTAYTITVVTGPLALTVWPFPPANTVATADAYILKTIPKPSGHRNTVFVLWQPPIGIMDHDQPLGAGDWRFSLNPNSNYKLAGIESGQGTYAAPIVAPTNFNLTIVDVKLYVATAKASIPQGISTLYLMESQSVSKPAGTGANQNFEFTVPSSTRALTVFVQSGKAGSNPLIPPSMFKCIPSATIATAGTEKNIKSLQLTYSNVTKPSTRWHSDYTGILNELQQRYNDSLSESGLLMSSGGAESIDQWLERGPYFHYSFVRDAEDRSSQVQLSIDYSSLEENSNVFLVAWFSRAVELTTVGGTITAVRSLSV
jgi:hypothetical protein